MNNLLKSVSTHMSTRFLYSNESPPFRSNSDILIPFELIFILLVYNISTCKLNFQKKLPNYMIYLNI